MLKIEDFKGLGLNEIKLKMKDVFAGTEEFDWKGFDKEYRETNNISLFEEFNKNVESVNKKEDDFNLILENKIIKLENKGILEYSGDKMPAFLDKLFNVLLITSKQLSKKTSFDFDDFFNVEVKDGYEIKLKDGVFVEGGSYTPSFRSDEVKVLDLEVNKYQTTNGLWNEVMEQKRTLGSRLPITGMDFVAVLEFCNKLSEKYGLEPVYDITYPNGEKKYSYNYYTYDEAFSLKCDIMINQLDGEKTYPDQADFAKTEGFRLPTEVEWEWFARGGQKAIEEKTFDYKYSGSDNLDEVAVSLGMQKTYNAYGISSILYDNNNNNNNNRKYKSVGTKKANQLGLYDCSGNVWEYCYDTWESKVYTSNSYIFDVSKAVYFSGRDCDFLDDGYYIDNEIDSNDMYGITGGQVIRGGSAKTPGEICAISDRYSRYNEGYHYKDYPGPLQFVMIDWDVSADQVGFRVVRTLK